MVPIYGWQWFLLLNTETMHTYTDCITESDLTFEKMAEIFMTYSCLIRWKEAGKDTGNHTLKSGDPSFYHISEKSKLDVLHT